MFPKLSLDKNWIVCENNIDRGKMGFQETIFTLGNGYLGSRGILEEGYKEGYAGTYIAGVYDRDKGQSFELVNVPNPLGVEIYVNGKKLSMDDMEIAEHHRVLDMKRAVLLRHSVFTDAGRRYEYESTRFLSLADTHTGVMTFSFRSLDSDAHIVVRGTIDGTTRNEIQAVGSPIKHYSVTHTSDCGNGMSYLEAKTNDLGLVIGLASGYDVVTDVGVRSCADGESVVREFSLNTRKGKRYKFNQYISIYTSRDIEHDIKAACLNEVEAARKYGIPRLLKRHTRAWNRRWQYSDISIEGDSPTQKALRFGIYHLLIAAPPSDIDVSIAAKALSGEWYKGHVFWDTEIYMLPFFIYTQPRVAREFLIYRYRRLKQARDGAQAQGYKGILWPWESASSGKDETPQTWINFDGSVIPVYNPKREHHIASDVVYGVFLYYQVTGDEDFMLRYGVEMILETARFWASRVIYDERLERYEIRKVIGPNEFQECVNNNSYINVLARWTLRYASELYHRLAKKHPRKLRTTARKIGLKDREVDAWKEIAEKIVLFIRPDGLIEEFEGYFARKDVTINERDENGMPIWPSEVKLAKAKETQLVKQADVLLLLHLFLDEFSIGVKRINFDYYEKRTTHKSSLSIPSHAILANELGKTERAYKYFIRAANADLDNIYGNTELGIHAAALGGAWQIAINGFAGARVKDNVLSITPVFPEHWQSMRFRIWFKGTLIEFSLSKDEMEAFTVKSRKGVNVELYGRKYFLYQGQGVSARKTSYIGG